MQIPTHQTVRDLHWAINSTSPYILEGLYLWCDNSPWFEDFLNELNAHPQPLMDYIAKNKSTALGIYFESLWQFYFSHHPEYEIIAQNLQIIIDKQTLGELDLVVKHVHTKQVTHIELSTKFYMNIANNTTLTPLDCWYGPNLADNLDIKYHKTLSHQLPFVQQSPVLDYLNSHGVQINRSIAILKGRAFYSFNKDEAKQHYWLAPNNLSQLDENSTYHILDKADWLAEKIKPDNSLTLLTADQCQSHFLNLGDDFKPTQAAIFNSNSQEYARVFIASNAWLHTAQQRLHK